jgi:DNA polymerase-3 subunit gamma/tau
VYIVDEAHELTNAAWDAFLKTLEEPPPHAIFVLATTEAHKVPPTILSRCQRFDFRRIPFQPTRELLAQVAASEGIEVEPAVLERLALVARGGLRDALSLLDQLAAFASGRVDMAVARAALSLPSIEAVRGVIDGMTRHDPSAVMVLMSDAADGGADLRLFAEELVVHLRAVLLLRTGADARLTDELPEDEVAWLRERAAAWSVGALMRLIQTLSDALARTRDAQQFQVQTEVALLIACDVETVTAPARPPAPNLAMGESSSTVASAGSSESSPTAAAASTDPSRSVAPSSTTRSGPRESSTPTQPVTLAPTAATGGPSLTSTTEGSSELSASTPPVNRVAADAPPAAADSVSPATPVSADALRSRWPDVIEHVKNRNPILASLLGSAHPTAVEGEGGGGGGGNLLVVAFGTEFNRKSAESRTNRQIIEAAFERVYGVAYRLRCMVRNGADGEPSLLDDPVINYAARTFGGEPKRL